eukprot:TRINITY_DN5684_c0_g2_i1.p1 TRINITY_DN5684_c0_g2~~TRINITY_DN5684_c0_g2_i1.p1  ORF type:complete len:601 (+),score=97.36 TRINITY_DN5684_c0_g2_i1:208-2010(+)
MLFFAQFATVVVRGAIVETNGTATQDAVHTLLIVLCGIYALAACAAAGAFGSLVYHSGCYLTKQSSFHFIMLATMILRVISFVLKATTSTYNAAAYNFTELLPEMSFVVGFGIIILEWAECYASRHRQLSTKKLMLPFLIAIGVVVVIDLLLWILTTFLESLYVVLEWTSYAFSSVCFLILCVCFWVCGYRVDAVLRDMITDHRTQTSALRKNVKIMVLLVSVGCLFRAGAVVGFNLYLAYIPSQEASVATTVVVYSLFYLVGELLPCTAGWLLFRHKLPGTGGSVTAEHRYLLGASMGSDNDRLVDPRLGKWQVHLDTPLIKKIDASELQVTQQIGQGSFGRVYRGLWHGTEVAIKQMRIDEVLNDSFIGNFCREIALLSELRHPNIVQFLGACMRESELCIVTEYMSRGSLFDVLHSADSVINKTTPADEPMDMAVLLRLATDCAQGMCYLHAREHPIIHRDLKTANLLVTSDLRCKVADFGISIQKTTMTTRQGFAGSPSYTPPEVLRNEPDCYTEHADVFGFAVILWEMYTRRIPWSDMSPWQVIAAVATSDQRLPIPEHCPDDLRQLIQDCWHTTPTQRPLFDVILHRLADMRGE